MAPRNKVEILISARDAASKALKNTGKSVDVLKERLGKLKGTVFNLKTAFAGLGAGLLARNLMQASNEQAKAVLGLEAAMKAMGRYTPELSASLQDYASSLQDVTNYGDEATIAGQKFLVTYKDITDDLLPRSTKTMLDLAAMMGGDVVQASNMLGKASMGMTDLLRRVGISVDKNTYKAEGYVGVLKAIETQVSGQAQAQRKATGTSVALGNSMGDLKEKMGDIVKLSFEDTFKGLLAFFDELNRAFGKLRETGVIDKWATDISKAVISSFESMLLGTSAFYDGIKPILIRIKAALFSIWDTFKALPGWAQDVGLVVAVLGGKKIAVAVAGLAHLYNAIKNIKHAVSLISDGEISIKEFSQMNAKELAARIDQINSRVKRFKINIESTVTPVEDLFKKFAGAKTATEKVQILLQYLRQLREEQDKSPGKDVAGNSAGTEPSSPTVSSTALDKSYLTRLKEKTKTALAQLESLYKQGGKTLEEYFAERKAEIEKQYNAEIAALKKLAEAETDLDKQQAINDQIFAKQEAHKRTLIELTNQQIETEKEYAEQKIRLDSMMEGLKQRSDTVSTGGGGSLGDMGNAQAEEQAAMDARHAEELASLSTLADDKLAIEQGYQDKLAIIEDAARMQKQEKEALLLEQERLVREKQLEMASEMAGGLSDIFTDLYVMSGKKNKKMFMLAKAAAIAESMINTSLAISSALSEKPAAYGMAMAAILAVKGAIEVAKIRAQTLAAGGRVLGNSPTQTSDNVPVMATAGEWVQPVKSVKYYGAGIMEAMRKRMIPRELFASFSPPDIPSMQPSFAFASGGQIGPSTAPAQRPAPQEQQEVNITNIVDPNLIEQHLATSAGQKTILNVLSQNAYEVQRIMSE